MSAAITLISATVKHSVGKTLNTQYGEKINVVLTLPDGSERKEWGYPNDPYLKSLKKGDSVQLIKDGDRYRLIHPEEPPEPDPAPAEKLGTTSAATPTAPQLPRWSKEHKQALAEEAQQRAALLYYCHDRIRSQFTNQDGELPISDHLVVQYAIALFQSLPDL